MAAERLGKQESSRTGTRLFGYNGCDYAGQHLFIVDLSHAIGRQLGVSSASSSFALNETNSTRLQLSPLEAEELKVLSQIVPLPARRVLGGGVSHELGAQMPNPLT